MLAYQDLQRGIEISLKKVQGAEICHMDRTRIFLQKDLKT